MPVLHYDRKVFARLLANIVATDKPLIYMDESSFNSFMIQRRSWAVKYHPNRHPIAPHYHSTTAFGAIGNCLVQPVYMTADSTNIVDFIRFLHLIRDNLKPDLQNKPFLLFDMHSAHLNSES